MTKVFLLLATLALVATSCGSKPDQKSVKYQLYFARGEELYAVRCSNCHQASGKGLGLVYPPLDRSDFMDKHFDDLPCLIKYGKRGELFVNGDQFNQPMPGVPTLTELEVAEITTYICNSWGRDKGIVEVPVVTAALQQCDR